MKFIIKENITVNLVKLFSRLNEQAIHICMIILRCFIKYELYFPNNSFQGRNTTIVSKNLNSSITDMED